MKKIFVIITVLLATAFSSNAQSEQKFHFGLKASPSLAWVSTDSKGATSEGTKLGFGYGLITEFNFSDHYAFATGIDVNYRGGKMKFSSESTSGGVTTTSILTSSLTIQYIELPITLKLKTNEIGYLTYFLQAGISPGLNIRAKADNSTAVQINGSPIQTLSEDNVDIKDQINNFNLSMILGGGVEYTLSGSTVLLVGITFNNGFLDVFDSSELKANSNFLGLTVGVLF